VNPDDWDKYHIKRGLREKSGKGVMTGLTNIAEVKAYTIVDEETVPCEGKLYYHGYDIEDLVAGFVRDNRFGFEETVYLLLFGELPTAAQLDDFRTMLMLARNSYPPSFTRNVILHAPGKDIMNALMRSVITLYYYDENADDISNANMLRQCLYLISLFPQLAVHSYQAYMHYQQENSLYIHMPQSEFSTAENILHMLRPDNSFTKLEARVLDLALILHADHGGGNNSTFAARVISSSGTDTYSVMTGALGSLKGPRHGGANIKVAHMFDDIKAKLKDWTSDTEIRQYLSDILDKKAFDKSGLIYGIGHAVYSLSDPRANLFKQWVEQLSVEKNKEEELALYMKIEKLAPQVIGEKRHIYKGVSANVDFYSGFVYQMLDIPEELFTPLFAIARIAGWSAHRIEEMVTGSKIIRPAYKNVHKKRAYTPVEERKEL
jgi:citrate synthase